MSHYLLDDEILDALHPLQYAALAAASFPVTLSTDTKLPTKTPSLCAPFWLLTWSATFAIIDELKDEKILPFKGLLRSFDKSIVNWKYIKYPF